MWRKISGPFKEFGLGAGTFYVLGRILRAISPHLGLYVYELMVQPVTDQPLLPANLAKDLSLVEIGRDHPDIELMPAQGAIKQARFEQGAICLGVYRKSKLIGYIWFCFDTYDEDEVRCTYLLDDAKSSVFDFDLYVLPEYRMGIGFMAVWHGANAYLHGRGVKYTFSRLTRFNLASRRSHAHLGWRLVAHAIFLQAWRIEVMLAGIFPYVTTTWKPSQRVKLRLSPSVLGDETTGLTPIRSCDEQTESLTKVRRP